MIEKTIRPSTLTITFCHPSDSEKKQKTWQWLDEIIKKGEQDKIPQVVVVCDPDTKNLLVYNGNIRTLHAISNCYDLKVTILFNQDDLDNHLKNNAPAWFGIRNFDELVEFMRIYAAYPTPDTTNMPEDLKKKVSQKDQEWQMGQAKKFFGWYDDD